MHHDTTPLWSATRKAPRFEALDRDLDVDIAIVGAGVSGLTAAVLLSRTGLRVVVLERDRIGSGETGHTTSHLTEAVDASYQRIIQDFGEDAARLVARSSRDAIDCIESLAQHLGVDSFERVPGYLYTEDTDRVDWLADELDAARRAGCAVEWIDDVPVPFPTSGGIRWDRQAQIHATEYLAALAKEADTHRVQLYETTKVTGVHDGHPCRVETEHHVVRARHVFVAANVPVNNRFLLHTKLAPYRSYVVAGEVEAGCLGGLFWDADDPYHYIRSQEIDGQWYVLVGGEDHRTGEVRETEYCYERLLDYARARLPIGPLKYRWSGQIIEPVDGLPFIGHNSGSTHVWVATGFAGNGMTFGTLAGMMVADFVVGRTNRYAHLYDATRVKPLVSAYDYIAENAAFPVHLIKDRLTSANADVQSLDDLQPGQGGLVAGPDGKLAVYRDERGELHGCSPVCPHMGCDVAWNGAERTWDCPCHGSRFSADGQVINGPAISDLSPRPLPTRA